MEVLERADVIYKMAKTIFINVLVDMSVEFRWTTDTILKDLNLRWVWRWRELEGLCKLKRKEEVDVCMGVIREKQVQKKCNVLS